MALEERILQLFRTLAAGGEAPWFVRHWKGLVLALIASGVCLDGLSHLIRNKPAWFMRTLRKLGVASAIDEPDTLPPIRREAGQDADDGAQKASRAAPPANKAKERRAPPGTGPGGRAQAGHGAQSAPAADGRTPYERAAHAAPHGPGASAGHTPSAGAVHAAHAAPYGGARGAPALRPDADAARGNEPVGQSGNSRAAAADPSAPLPAADAPPAAPAAAERTAGQPGRATRMAVPREAGHRPEAPHTPPQPPSAQPDRPPVAAADRPAQPDRPPVAAADRPAPPDRPPVAAADRPASPRPSAAVQPVQAKPPSARPVDVSARAVYRLPQEEGARPQGPAAPASASRGPAREQAVRGPEDPPAAAAARSAGADALASAAPRINPSGSAGHVRPKEETPSLPAVAPPAMEPAQFGAPARPRPAAHWPAPSREAAAPAAAPAPVRAAPREYDEDGEPRRLHIDLSPGDVQPPPQREETP